jgi:hypothetical protein
LFSSKFKSILVLFGTMAVIFILAASINNLELRRGISSLVSGRGGGGVPDGKIVQLIFIQMLLFTIGLMFPIALILVLFSKRRFDILKRLAVIIITMTIAYFAFNVISKRGFQVEVPPVEFAPANSQTEAVPEPFEASPSSLLVFSVSLILSLVMMVGGLFLWRVLRRKPTTIEKIAEEAQKTLDDLERGGDIKEGVIKCYHEMNRVLDEQHSLKRFQAMTTREFEIFLGKAGFDNQEIKQLTRLFEKVRYGNKQLDHSEEQEAVECLTSIVKASKRAAS